MRGITKLATSVAVLLHLLERPLQAGPIQRLRALAGIDDHFEQLQVVQLCAGLHLGALGIEAVPSPGVHVSHAA